MISEKELSEIDLEEFFIRIFTPEEVESIVDRLASGQLTKNTFNASLNVLFALECDTSPNHERHVGETRATTRKLLLG